MKKNLSKLATICLAFSIAIGNSFMTPVQAATSNNESYDISQIETIAKNAPQYVLGNDKTQWSDVYIVNSKPLYDFNDKLVAYSLDLKSNINNENAFVIVSTSQGDEPILEFGAEVQSPYDKVNDTNQTCIFDGFQGYYSHGKSNNKYHDIANNKDLEDTEIKIHVDNSKNKQYVSSNPNIAKQNRLNLKQKTTKNSEKALATTSSSSIGSATVGQTPVTVVTSKTLPVPDYRWYHGCAPTSASMILKYRYASNLSSVTTNNLIDELVTAMNTTLPAGSTVTDNIPTGIKSVMSKHGVSVSATNYKGRSNATFDRAVTEINNGRPFIASLLNSTETARSYPNGFGSHSMAGVGYNITKSTNSSGVTTIGNYIVVHDTGCDGDVYCNYDSSQLGTPIWTTVK